MFPNKEKHVAPPVFSHHLSLKTFAGERAHLTEESSRPAGNSHHSQRCPSSYHEWDNVAVTTRFKMRETIQQARKCSSAAVTIFHANDLKNKRKEKKQNV